MKTRSKITIATAILFIAPVAFACNYPKRANVPIGATASTEEMLAGQKSVKAYMSAMDEYLACIDTEEENSAAALIDASDDELARREAAITKKYNAAVTEMELIAARFNEEVRAYKAQSD
jgi:hypothetical protein